MTQNYMEEKRINYEPPVFWVFTAATLVVTIAFITMFAWFVYIGHEPLEPVHDEFPHAALIKVQDNYA